MDSGAKGFGFVENGWMHKWRPLFKTNILVIQTIVLSHLEPDQAAEILVNSLKILARTLMMRIANLEEVQPAALQELNDIMEKQFAGQRWRTGRENGRP